ncbi:MAG: hypothetical protein QOI15_2667 [Pseudonocardiales bacterium]|nr:hypothetical protein [Pseudonocardiales bacterium]
MMRRLISLATLALIAALAPVHAANAEPRVGPPLDLQLYLYEAGGPSGEDQASLAVYGRGCLPQDAPASVMVTLDRAPGQVFTAEPNAKGRWSVTIDIETPIDGVYLVNATCDNYFGETVYPQARTDADHVLIAANGSAGGSGGPPSSPAVDATSTSSGGVANTGSDTGSELGVGVLALALGVLLVFLGRPRRAVAAIRGHDSGRHRR